MLYGLIKILMQLLLRVFYRRIYIAGAEHIPDGKPVILACNHPNTFMDAIIPGALLKRPMYFLARGDAFNGSWTDRLLTAMKVLPIYRLSEGAEHLHKNEETFSTSADLLALNHMILIFTEGLSVLEKRLRPLKKGTARLAFGAEEAYHFQLDVQIVPVAINYTTPRKTRSEVMIRIAKPFSLLEFKELYKQNAAQAYRKLNERIQAGIHEGMIHIRHREDDRLTERMLAMHRSTYAREHFRWKILSGKRLKMEMKVADFINHLHHYQPEKLAKLKKLTNSYFLRLNKNRITDNAVARKGKISFWKWIILVFGSFVFIVGMPLNIIPYRIAKGISWKALKDKDFYASMLISVCLIFYSVYYLLIFALLTVFTTWWLGLATTILLAVIGWLAVRYQEMVKSIANFTRYLGLHAGQQAELQQLREEIMNIK